MASKKRVKTPQFNRFVGLKQFKKNRKMFVAWKNFTKKMVLLRLKEAKYIDASNDMMKRNMFVTWFQKCYDTQRAKSMAKRVLVRAHKRTIKWAFYEILHAAQDSKRQEKNFDVIHEKYIVNLIERSFD
mmetsp:Transcript_21482/g.18551  ORF Transcript_21482/g.18551 Transcript_21482/m.18551 type:complete len:129 (+) Transcript_21482:639-1025(+)